MSVNVALEPLVVVADPGHGRSHQTRDRLPVHDLAIASATTGELLREPILDPNRDYRPTGTPKGPRADSSGRRNTDVFTLRWTVARRGPRRGFSS